MRNTRKGSKIKLKDKYQSEGKQHCWVPKTRTAREFMILLLTGEVHKTRQKVLRFITQQQKVPIDSATVAL